MVHDIPWLLLEKFFARETTEDQNRQVEEWMQDAPENTMIFDQLKEHYRKAGSLPLEFIPDTCVALNKVNQKIKINHKKTKVYSFGWYAAAASVILLVAFLWLTRNTISVRSQSLLSLCSADSATTSIVLSDGTHVWLNAGSKLEYPEKFKATREVNLSGEGYFEVAHDASHPFLVKTTENIIKVLGTKFDMRSYPKEGNTSLFVTDGRVSFGNHQGNQVVLSKGQRSSYSYSNKTFEEVSALDPNSLAWKTNVFTFDNKPLNTVFHTLSEVYHFRYTFTDKTIENRRITTQFKELPLRYIVSIIATATNTEIILKTYPQSEVIINPAIKQ